MTSGVYPSSCRILKTPAGFSFERTVLGHGWFDLPPFEWDGASRRLTRMLLPGGSRPVSVEMSGAGGGVRVVLRAATAITPGDVADAVAQARHMLRLDEDFADFAALAERTPRPDLREPIRAGAGRLLRAPTVFEDLVKLICTTNCTWSLTRVMVTAMVERLGGEGPDGRRAFPAAAALADASPRFFRHALKTGYRAEGLRNLARDVAADRLDPERWLDPERPTADLRREILSVRGAGPYVADNLLKLLGRYDGYGIDSWCRREFSRLNARGRRVTDARIERFYAPFGRWRGLALWCDMTREWFSNGNPLVAASSKVTPAR